MATVASNTKKRKQYGTHAAWPVASNATINQGDLLVHDDTNHVAALATNDASIAKLIGVAEESFPINSLGTGDGSTRQLSVQVGWGDVYEFKTTSGDTYHDGDQVYIGADAQTVTNTAGGATHPLGIVRLPIGVASVAAAAGVTVDVLVNTKTIFN